MDVQEKQKSNETCNPPQGMCTRDKLIFPSFLSGEQHIDHAHQSEIREKLQQIKKHRGGYKGSLTNKEIGIRELIKDCSDVKVVSDKLQEIKHTFSKFHAKHLQYRSLVEKCGEDLSDIDEYYKVAEQNFHDFEAEVKDWIGNSSELSCSQLKGDDIINPEDSVSNATSKVSSVDSLKVKLRAKRAALLAQAKSMKQLQAVKRQQMDLQHVSESLQLQGELAAVEAEEKIYMEYSSRVGSKVSKSEKTEVKVKCEHTELKSTPTCSFLNPDAAEWPGITAVKSERLSFDDGPSSQRQITGQDQDKRLMLQLIDRQQGMMDDLQTKMDMILTHNASVYQPDTNKSVEGAGFQNPYFSHNSYEKEQKYKQVSPIDQEYSCKANDNPGERSTSTEDRLIQLQQQMLDAVQLPKAELMTFNGDPLQFWTFTRAFDNCVGMTNVSDSVKLNRLFQYCSGKALDVIQCCTLLPPDKGYIQGRQLLKERFGNDYVISKAWIDRVTSGVNIKPYDNDALRSYADDVKNCMLTLNAMGKLNEVDNQTKMVKLIQKLPAYLQGRWRQKAVNMLHSEGKYPDIVILADFIETAARKQNDPVFGCSPTYGMERKLSAGTSQKGLTQRNQGASFNVKTDNGMLQLKPSKPDAVKIICHLCSENHPLSKCEMFKDMTPLKRVEFAKEKNLCFNCFSTRHRSTACQKDSRCSVPGCVLTHSKLLHIPFNQRAKPETQKETQSAKVHSSTSNQRGASVKIALPIVPVKIRAPGQRNFISAYALLDSGSTNTFCSQELIDNLAIKGNDTTLTLTTLGKACGTSQTTMISLEVTDTKERHLVAIPCVFSTPKLPDLRENVVDQVDLSRWPYLNGINFPKIDGNQVMLLIGQDAPTLLAPIETRSGKQGEPYATRSALGWTLNGPLHVQGRTNAVSHFVWTDQTLQDQVEIFWKLETSESIQDIYPQMSIEDKRVMDIWEKSIRVIDGHYQMDIPFKSQSTCLPDNYHLAKVCLESLGRKLVKQPQLWERYRAEMHSLFDKGFAEKVPKDEILTAKGNTWYLPHHGVTSEKKPDKLRIVFDCAAKYTGVSLNDNVLQGPDMTNTLMGVLLRFREHKIGVMGDIESMFHQVKVSPKDRDVLRFLWWENDNLENDPQVYRMTVHLFGGVWSPSCASFALRRTAMDNIAEFDTDVTKAVHKDFYVDDCLKSLDTEQEAVTFVDQLSTLLQIGGFKITKWVSNNKRVMDSIPIDRRAKEYREIGVNPLPAERALGVYWETDKDELGFKIVPKSKPDSRRGLMSIISSLYDPFGFACPFVLLAKKLFQDECKMGKCWDDPLSEPNLRQWQLWKQELPELENFKVKRCIIPSDVGEIVDCQIHHFADASLDGYGTVSYLRVVNGEGRISSGFLMGKARLAPIKQLTIPRLELSAAVLSVKVDRMLRRELDLEIHRSVFWSDSMIVLHYIKSTTKRFQIFVANRVASIHEGSRPTQWRHVDSANNPADGASRGLHAKEIVKGKTWIDGPAFLNMTEDAWPDQPDFKENFLQGDKEIKQDAKVCTVSENSDVLDSLVERYSTWNRLRKSVTWLLRFKQLLLEKSKASKQTSFNWDRGGLRIAEINAAERQVLKIVQQQCYSGEIDTLAVGKHLKKTSPIFSLDPVLDVEGILVAGGRLSNAVIKEEAKHPVIIPKGHHVGTLIVRHYHNLLGHSGKEHVLEEIRQKYWLIRARPTVNRVLKKCSFCTRRRAKACGQRMSDLPADRVAADKPAFTSVGVDCFGPFLVKRGRSVLKRYGCLFTCLATRAIHLEKLDTMETDCFINAFTRFQCRRGRPDKVRSDNGTNFTGAQRELYRAIKGWNHKKIENHLQQHNTQWEFNPPAASHMGGAWERQIRSVRRILLALLKDQCLDDEGLETVFCEAESIVNSRPLTAVSDDPRDLDPITPNHLLLLRSGPGLPYGEFVGGDTYRRRWKYVQFLADNFWKRWRREYLSTLQIRQKWHLRQRNLKEGDIVLVLNENVPRRDWPLARVVKTFPGADGLVRMVDVKTRWSLLKRPVDKLCLLESVDD